jgi:hypothetical protein
LAGFIARWPAIRNLDPCRSRIADLMDVSAWPSMPGIGVATCIGGELAILRGELEKTIAFNFWLWLIVRVSQNNHVYQPDQTGSFGCQ